jgi:hypothetical protein
MTGCSSFVSPFNNSSYTSNADQTDTTDSTDDVPYAIGQYLDQIRIAQDGQQNEPATQQKLAVQK